jgi:hypothetical protein
MVEAFARGLSGAAVAFLFSVCALAAAAESSGDWQISTRIDSVTAAKILNVKLKARKTAHDGLFLPPDALLQLGCLKNHPLSGAAMARSQLPC